MKAFVVTDKTCSDEIRSELRDYILNEITKNNYSYELADVDSDEISYCIGCFGCWLKTPGVCIFNDVGRKYAKSCIESDYIILLTPVKYGCYSVAIKKALDRLIPIVLPFFKKFNNEVHHSPRYKKYPQFVVVGYGNDISSEEEHTFRKLTLANAINFQKEKSLTYICRNQEDVKKTITDCFNDIAKEYSGVNE